MKQKLLKNPAIFIVPGIIFLAIGVLVAADQPAKGPTEAPEMITIENKGYKKDQKGPVEFKHKKHQEEYKTVKGEKIQCTECHHKYDKEGKNLWKEGDPVQKCASTDCHDPEKKLGKKQEKLQIAFHNNCKDCHKAVVEAGLKKEDEAPYKKCTSCMHGK